jgi:hypothetical protein
LLSACSDDGAIILKLIKSLLKPLSADLVKEYAGEEAGVGLHDIGNTLTEAWSALSVAKGYLVDSFITDTDLMSIWERRRGGWEEAQRMLNSDHDGNGV